MNSIRLESALMVVILAAGCACEHGIGLMGDQDTDQDADLDASEETSQGSWEPPIENLGEPGWRDSTEPWCWETRTQLWGYDVWSDPGSVYVLGTFVVMEDGHCPGDDCYARSGIFRNDGTGWTLFYEGDVVPNGPGLTGISEITGYPGGPIYALETRTMEGCLFNVIDAEGKRCACAELPEVLDVFFVSDHLAYAIDTDGQKVYYWDGIDWGPVPAAYTPYAVYNLWASEEALFCSGSDGTVVSLEDGNWRIHDTRTAGNIGRLWGFGPDDVWALGGDTGLMHWDGASWTHVDWPGSAEPDTLWDMWGSSDGVLFVSTTRILVRHEAGLFRVILDLSSTPGILIKAIWGNSSTEIFVALSEGGHDPMSCEAQYLMWWDGASFHWF